MTGLLETALRRVEALPDSEQDAIAAQIMEILDEEAAWERALEANVDRLDAQAREALAENRRGEAVPLEDFLNEEE